jgi:hypothetical protein
MGEGLSPFDRGCWDHWRDDVGRLLGGGCSVHHRPAIEDTYLVVVVGTGPHGGGQEGMERSSQRGFILDTSRLW